MGLRNVAITGAMGSGKTSIAAVLVNAGYTKTSFAEPIRNVAALAYGTIDKGKDYEIEDAEGHVSTVSGRAVLQRVGQFIKHHDNLFWTRAFTRNADNINSPLITDDMRFLHEYKALSQRGWIIVGLQCPVEVRIERLTAINGRPPTQEELHHESEIEVPIIIEKADMVLDSTLDPYVNAQKILEVARATHN